MDERKHPQDRMGTEEQPYDGSELTYANSFPSPGKRWIISLIEWLTGRWKLLRLVRSWERTRWQEPNFWESSLDHMGIDVTTPKDEVARIPAEGPLIIVANHPHGLVDGMVMARLISFVRDDFKILTRSLLTKLPRIEDQLLPVAFPHEEGAIQTNLQTRRLAIEHLQQGGCVSVFPAGTVATSETFFGPAKEKIWMPFTAKMIRQTGARVLPVYFPGQNSRIFQIANLLSTTLRQSFLLHEIVHALNKNQCPRVGEFIDPEVLKSFEKDAIGLMAYLKDETYKLKALGRV